MTPVQVERWHAAIEERHSRRSYDGHHPDLADLDALETLTTTFRPFPGARVALVREASANLFVGIIGAYGGISGARSALVFIGGKNTPPESVGYTGEALVLEATVRGLSTCWVGGMFSAAHAARSAGALGEERVFGISPVGHALESVSLKERFVFKTGRPKRRRTVEEVAPGYGSWPTWAREAVLAVGAAPSAMNRQPWRFRLDGDALVVSFDGQDTPRISKRLDCGIAMLHAELGAATHGAPGTWELLGSPDVARFTPG
jgi:hypothetical protein